MLVLSEDWMSWINVSSLKTSRYTIWYFLPSMELSAQGATSNYWISVGISVAYMQPIPVMNYTGIIRRNNIFCKFLPGSKLLKRVLRWLL